MNVIDNIDSRQPHIVVSATNSDVAQIALSNASDIVDKLCRDANTSATKAANNRGHVVTSSKVNIKADEINFIFYTRQCRDTEHTVKYRDIELTLRVSLDGRCKFFAIAVSEDDFARLGVPKRKDNTWTYSKFVPIFKADFAPIFESMVSKYAVDLRTKSACFGNWGVEILWYVQDKE